MALPATDDPSKTTLVSGVDVALTAARDGEHPEEAMKFIEFLMQPDVMSDYCKAQVAIPTLKGLKNDDPALAGVQRYIDSGRIVGFTDHQFIPAIPLAPLLQTFMLDGDKEQFLDRPRRQLGPGRATPDLGTGSSDLMTDTTTSHGAATPSGAEPGRRRRRQQGPAVARDLLPDGAAGARAVLRVPHDPGDPGHLLQLHRLARLRPVRASSGFSNYVALFSDPRVIHAYWFTFLIAVVATVLVNIVSLAIAVGLNGKIKWKTALRGIYFIPNVLAILVVGYIFNYLFNNSLPALGEQAGHRLPRHLAADQGEHRVDRDRHPRGLAGGRVQHHHLHRRPADGAGGALRGRGARRRVRVAGSSAASRSR